MDTRVAAALIHFRHASVSLEAFGTGALEAIDQVFTGPAMAAGVAGAFIDVDVAHFSCVAWFTCTLIAVNLINALPRVAWVAGAVVQIDLTVCT